MAARGGGVAMVPGSAGFPCVTVDLSFLEPRFQNIFERLDAMEVRLHDATSVPASTPLIVETANFATDDVAAGKTTTLAHHVNLMDPSEIAHELETLRATQLRFRIEHELAQSTIRADIDRLRRDLEARPDHSDFANFRAEMDVLATTTRKNVEDQHEAWGNNVHVVLSAREVAENAWKAEFESTIQARIQDLWAGFKSSQRKTKEAVESMETQLVHAEGNAREALACVEHLAQVLLKDLDKRLTSQEATGESHRTNLERIQTFLDERYRRLEEQDLTLDCRIDELTKTLDGHEKRSQMLQLQTQEIIVTLEKNVAQCLSELGGARGIVAHQEDKIRTMDRELTSQMDNVRWLREHAQKVDTRVQALDERLTQHDKQLTSVIGVLEEHHDANMAQIYEIHRNLEQATSERLSAKRQITELSFSLQEQHQTLQEVSNQGTSHDMALARVAGEVAKLHVQGSTTLAELTSNQKNLATLSHHVDQDRAFTKSLNQRLDEEHRAMTGALAVVDARAQAIQEQITATHITIHETTRTLEAADKDNGNRIHQLYSMVDALALTESATELDDKLGQMALVCAERGLQLEHVTAHHAASANAKDEIRGELAMHLTKVLRVLSTGLALEQTKYFLATKRLTHPTAESSSSSSTSGALVLELSAHQALEQMRQTMVQSFVGRVRQYMEQLEPVGPQVRHVHAFREHFARKVQYILDFGLANLFPNLGRPRHPNRRVNTATCIACDRPLEAPDDGEFASSSINSRVDDLCDNHREAEAPVIDPETEAVEDMRMRRNKLVSGTSGTASTTTMATTAAAGMTRRVDTRTPVKGRSGGWHPGQRPKNPTPAETAIHHAPGTGEYVYRAGFRLPRPSSAAASSTSSKISSGDGPVEVVAPTATSNVTTAGAKVNAGTSPSPALDVAVPAIVHPLPPSGSLDDGLNSCLEKVALVGTKQQQAMTTTPTIEVPTIRTAPGMLVRPHTAPLRAKSLPRLEMVTEPQTLDGLR